MTERREINQVLLKGTIDIAITLVSLYLASWARYLIPWGARLPWRFVSLPWPVYAMTTVIWPTVFSLIHVYDIQPHNYRRFRTDIKSLVMGMGFALLSLAGSLYLSFREVPRRQFFYFGIIDFFLLTLVRLFFHLLRNRATRNGSVTRLLIAGAGRVGERIGRKIQNHNGNWYLVGFLDDDENKIGKCVADAPVLAHLDALQSIVQSEAVDEVIFTLPMHAYDRLANSILGLERLPVEISVVPDYFDLAFFRTRMDELFGLPLIRLRASAIEGPARVAKRLFDLAISIPMLAFSLLLFPPIALAIRLDSPGPVLFKQERVGENGHTFKMWKLRTMVQNADALLPEVLKKNPDGQIIHKKPDDPRITRVGHFLRRFSLDELPQLVNVIKGDMSLVGPRPELPQLVDKYESWQRKRFAVPPGITGWWQVSGRSDRPMHLHVEDDLYYIQNYSIWFDLQILWRTVGAVISGKGAY